MEDFVTKLFAEVENDMQEERTNQIKKAARDIHSMYASFVEAGFTADQSLKLTIAFMTSTIQNSNTPK